MRVILDTNCFLVCISRKSQFYPIFDQLLRGRLTLVMSDELLLEYEEILSQKANPVVAENIRDFLLNDLNIHWQRIFYRWLLLYADPDDNKLVDLAIASNADYLVTNDKHFNELHKISFPRINIIPLEEFHKLVTQP